LLCLCNESNTNIARLVLIPNAEHIHAIAMLKGDDERMSNGVRLRLRDLRRIAHQMSRTICS
jgi:hypothetical protein